MVENADLEKDYYRRMHHIEDSDWYEGMAMECRHHAAFKILMKGGGTITINSYKFECPQGCSMGNTQR